MRGNERRRLDAGPGVRLLRSLALAGASLVLAACGLFSVRDAPASFEGPYLVDRSGFTLYRYDRDVPFSRSSTCVDRCTELWRPYLAAPGARRSGEFALIARTAGERQWVFRGVPLYRYALDRKPGEFRGQGVDDLWRVVER